MAFDPGKSRSGAAHVAFGRMKTLDPCELLLQFSCDLRQLTC
jgi:hypothetical protein